MICDCDCDCVCVKGVGVSKYGTGPAYKNKIYCVSNPKTSLLQPRQSEVFQTEKKLMVKLVDPRWLRPRLKQNDSTHLRVSTLTWIVLGYNSWTRGFFSAFPCASIRAARSYDLVNRLNGGLFGSSCTNAFPHWLRNATGSIVITGVSSTEPTEQGNLNG